MKLVQGLLLSVRVAAFAAVVAIGFGLGPVKLVAILGVMLVSAIASELKIEREHEREHVHMLGPVAPPEGHTITPQEVERLNRDFVEREQCARREHFWSAAFLAQLKGGAEPDAASARAEEAVKIWVDRFPVSEAQGPFGQIGCLRR